MSWQTLSRRGRYPVVSLADLCAVCRISMCSSGRTFVRAWKKMSSSTITIPTCVTFPASLAFTLNGWSHWSKTRGSSQRHEDHPMFPKTLHKVLQMLWKSLCWFALELSHTDNTAQGPLSSVTGQLQTWKRNLHLDQNILQLDLHNVVTHMLQSDNLWRQKLGHLGVSQES